MSDSFLNIKISVLSLCKNNNGFFKSEKQAKYLISQLKRWGGHIGQNDSGYNTCPLSAEWDDDGIIKTTKYTKSKGRVTVWERRVSGVLTEADKKLLNRRKRKLKELNKQLAYREVCVVTVDDARIEAEQKKLDEFNHYIENNTLGLSVDFIENKIRPEAETTKRLIEHLKRKPTDFEENTQKMRDRISRMEELIKDIESTEFKLKENQR